MMPSVTELLTNTWRQAPRAFAERDAALAFLESEDSSENKLQLALRLLEQVAAMADCPRSWAILVRDRLVPTETGMKHVLPKHRDHVVHSAHLYLLGVTVYLKLLRQDPVLSAVLVDTYYRDVQGLFGPAHSPYSCNPRLIAPDLSLKQARKLFPGEFALDERRLKRLQLLCCPEEAAGLDWHFIETVNALEQYRGEFKPVSHIQAALEDLAGAVGRLATRTDDTLARIPKSLEELDGVFHRRWGQAAILHDVAYPLELAAKQIGDYLEKTIGPLGCTFSPCPKPFGLQLNRLCDFVAVPLVQNVCTTCLDPEMCGDNSLGLLATNISHKLHVEYTPDTLARMMQSWIEADLAKGEIDHGVFSALLMLRLVNKELIDRLGDRRKEPDFVCDNPERRVTGDICSSAVEFFYIDCVDAAAAVYLHNTKKRVSLFKDRSLDYREHPYAWLLFLCDQLQEWLRPSGETDQSDLFKRANEYRIDFVDGPYLHFDFPQQSTAIRKACGDHLRLFGQEFVKCAQ